MELQQTPLPSFLMIKFFIPVLLFFGGYVGGVGVVVFGGGESVEQKQNVYQSFLKKKKFLLAYLKIYNVMHPVSIRTMCCDGVHRAVTCTQVYHSVRYLTLWPFLNLTWGIAPSAGCSETRGEGGGMVGGGGWGGGLSDSKKAACIMIGRVQLE